MICRKHRERALALLWLGLGGLFLLRPREVCTGFQAGLAFCTRSLLPSLFPLFVVTALAAENPCTLALSGGLRPLCRALGLGSPACAFLLFSGWLGGYTVLAAGTGRALAQKEITSAEGARLMACACVPSPGFAAAVGGLLGQPALGCVFYCASLAGGLLVGLGLRALRGPCRAASLAGQSPGAALGLPGSVARATESSLTVSGYVLFFYTITAVLPSTPLTPWLAGLLEVGTGCSLLARLSGPGAVYGCSAALSVMGLSVWCQLQALLGEGCSLGPALALRPFHTAFCLGCTALYLHFVPMQSPAVNTLSPSLVVLHRQPPEQAVLLFVLCCLVLHRLSPQKP